MTKQYKRQLLETTFTQDELNRLYNTKSYYAGSVGVVDVYKRRGLIYRVKAWMRGRQWA